MGETQIKFFLSLEYNLDNNFYVLLLMGKINGMIHKLWKENSTLETEIEFKRRWLSVLVIYFTIFLMTLGFGITLTGVWPYLDKVSHHVAGNTKGLNQFLTNCFKIISWILTLVKPFMESSLP